VRAEAAATFFAAFPPLTYSSRPSSFGGSPVLFFFSHRKTGGKKPNNREDAKDSKEGEREAGVVVTEDADDSALPQTPSANSRTISLRQN
jgi:hypothetical protein